MNTSQDKLIADFKEALTAAANASFDCGDFDWDECKEDGKDPNTEYTKLLKASQKARDKVLDLFKAAMANCA